MYSMTNDSNYAVASRPQQSLESRLTTTPGTTRRSHRHVRSTVRSFYGLMAGLFMTSAAMAADTLVVNQTMTPSQFLESANGSYRFTFQTDGNLVVYRQSDGAALWASNTRNQGGVRLPLQSDGNLVLYTSGSTPLWATNTADTPANRLVMQNDGNLVMYSTANAPLWSTGIPTTGAVSYIGTSINASTAATLSITRPASVQPGDLMILFTQGGDGQLPDTQNGWTRFSSCFERDNGDTACSTSGVDLGLVGYYRVASSGGAFTYTLNRGNAGHITAAIHVVRGANNANPIYSATYLPNDGTGTASHCPSTAGISNGYHICAFAHDDPQQLSGFSPLTLRASLQSGGDYVHVASGALTTTGNTPIIRAQNVNILGPGEGRNDLQLAVAIRPAP